MASKKKGNARLVPWLYDFVLWAMSVLVDLFFREVHPRGAWKVPRQGPIILVAAPHANQVRSHHAAAAGNKLTSTIVC